MGLSAYLIANILVSEQTKGPIEFVDEPYLLPQGIIDTIRYEVGFWKNCAELHEVIIEMLISEYFTDNYGIHTVTFPKSKLIELKEVSKRFENKAIAETTQKYADKAIEFIDKYDADIYYQWSV